MSHSIETELSVDVIVVGGGMSGASIAYEIAQHRTVALLERESTLAFHTTGRSAATFIENYGNPVIRTLTAASRDFFTDPHDGFDAPLATSLPLLIIADEAHADSLRELHSHAWQQGCHTELVDGVVAEEINPHLRPGYTQLATVDLTPMELDVHGLHQGYVRGLRRRGGTIVKSAGIVSGTRRQDRWVLHDASGRAFEATAVVNAAGAWCDELAHVMGARPAGIQPLRRTAFMVSAPPDSPTGSLPMTLDASDDFYFKPDGAQFLCSPADETPQPPGDPRPDELEMARAIGMINEATTLSIRNVNSAWAGLRSFTADPHARRGRGSGRRGLLLVRSAGRLWHSDGAGPRSGRCGTGDGRPDAERSGRTRSCGGNAGTRPPGVTHPALAANPAQPDHIGRILLWSATMVNMDRRRVMAISGLGMLTAAVSMPQAWAQPSQPPKQPPAAPPNGKYVFVDEFDGPAGSAPDGSKWAISKARESMKDPTFWELPENVGQYRDDRKNVYLDGNSNLVIKAAKEGNTYYGGKIYSTTELGIGYTWEARIKFNCLTPGAWPAFWLGSDQDGEIDIVEWYGNGSWPSATTVHAKANGSEWKTHNIALDNAWHTWRTQWDDKGIRFWKDYTDGAAPYFEVPANSLADWPFNNPGHRVFPVLNLAVAGSGGGDPRGGTYPADMLVDWIRVW